MKNRTRNPKQRRSLLLRIAIVVVSLAQLATPLMSHTGSFSGADSNRPHWHATGDTLELGHDETACPACTLQQRPMAYSHSVHLVTGAIAPVRCVPTAQLPVLEPVSVHGYSRGPPRLG